MSEGTEKPKKESKLKAGILGALEKVYGSAENALKSVTSKRAYIIAALLYVAIQEMTDAKFCALSVVACFFIWSETMRKK